MAKKMLMEKKESTGKKTVFAANTLIGSVDASPVDAFSGVFPDDFSVVLDRNSGVLAFLVSKHLLDNDGTPKWFNYLVDVDNELVEIQKLGAKSIAELELKLDLYNLVWQ